MTLTNRKSRRHTENDDPHWIEWATGVISMILVATLIVWIGREAMTKNDTIPELSTSVVGIEKRGDFFVARVRIENLSSSTASTVAVKGVLTLDGGATETSETTFDYVPAESAAQGGLLFRADPSRGRLDIRPTGYTEP